MWRVKENKVFLSVRVLPNAKRAQIEGVWNETALKIAVRAPAVEGLANKALIDFLADFFDLKKKNISITHGETGREKTICFENADLQTLENKVKAVLNPA